MSHVRRIGVGLTLAFAVFVLGFVFDAVFPVLYDLNAGTSGPFEYRPIIRATVPLFVPMFLLGITLWIIWGAVRQERRENRRRVR